MPVRVFAAALIVFSVLELASTALFDALPMLSNEARGSDNFPYYAMMISLVLLRTLVTLVAGFALASNRGWARAWIICDAAATVVPTAFRFATEGLPYWWRRAAKHFEGPALIAFHYGRPVMDVTLALIALILLVGYEHRYLRQPTIRGRAWAGALIVVIGFLAALRILSSDVRAAWEEHAIATTSIEDGSGTAVVTLTSRTGSRSTNPTVSRRTSGCKR